jgi:hypothetical protein
MPGVRQKGLDNMKQISTGAGLMALGVGMVATALIATHRGTNEAFAQAPTSPRTIVAAGVHSTTTDLWMYRIWSDNDCDFRWLGKQGRLNLDGNFQTLR